MTKNFYKILNGVLKSGKISFFQMRFKKYSFEKKVLIGKKIRHLCKKNNVKFIVNDDPILAKKLNADGCHLGQKDMNIKEAKKVIKGKIIGTIIMTIGTHSNGHPSKNIITIIIAKIRYLFISKPNKNSVNKVGVPNRAKTAPKKFDAATKTIINAVISKVLTKASCNLGRVNFL